LGTVGVFEKERIKGIEEAGTPAFERIKSGVLIHMGLWGFLIMEMGFSEKCR